jgi:hypothetical protein
MKNLFKNTLLFLASFCFCMAVNGQTIRRVNNNAGVTGVNVYTTLQAAHDAATAGDIVYVEPSTTYYGNLTATKTLTYIGNGYQIASNTSSNMPFDSRPSQISIIDLNVGSANSSFIGVTIDQLNIYVPNINVNRCYLRGTIYLRYFGSPYATSISDNIIIKNCILENGSNTAAIYTPSQIPVSNVLSRYPSGLLIKNNIMSGPYGAINGVENAVVLNNTCRTYIAVGARNSIFVNNIAVAPTSGDQINLVNVACSFSNNLTFGASYLPSGNGNQNGVSSTNFFVVPNLNLNYPLSPDKDFQLSATSVGLIAGLNGSQVGAFGGAEPYLLSGLPSVPIITLNNNSGVGNVTTPLQVSTITRGNN